MAKVKKAYFCKNCGFEAPKWLGRCPSCGEWNTFTEEIVARESGSVPANVAGSLPAAKPQRVRDIRESEHRRMDLGNSEVNRVLGGGMVPGSLILLGGEPGIGKSTLSLQLALAANGLKTLYVSGEESAEQIKMRAGRIGIGNDESDLNAIYVRPDSPILKAKGANPRYPDVYGSADTVRGKLILCPEKTSAHYLLSTWLHILGLKDEDVKIQNVLPGPAVDMFSKGFGDAVSIWAPATYTAAQKGYQIAASSPDCGIRQPILLLADREFADKNPEQVRAFLRVYLRVVDAMHSEGFDAFVQEYIRFNKTWNEKLMTREEAVEDLRAHPVFSLGEQITLFHPESGNLRNWLRGITAFYGRIGELSQEDVANLNAFGFLNDSFLKGLQQ